MWAVLRRDWISLGMWELERCVWGHCLGNVSYLSNSTIDYDN